MWDRERAKAFEHIPIHADLVDWQLAGLPTGRTKSLIPNWQLAADPLVTQQWILKMMRGLSSPVYPCFQPGAEGGQMHSSKRRVTFEELLLRLADNQQSFPVVAHMHLTKEQRYLLKLWEVFVCDERASTHEGQKNFNMLPDDIVALQNLIILALEDKDHCVEWQEFKPPSNPREFPKKINNLENPHFEAMRALGEAGVRQALDDVSVCMADKEFCPEGHPYTPALCVHSHIQKYFCQIKLDIMDGAVIFQELPNMQNPQGYMKFKKCTEVGHEFVARVTKDAIKLMKDFVETGGRFTVEGSYQDKEGEFQSNKACDFQGCETHDWGEGMSAESAARAYLAMTNS